MKNLLAIFSTKSNELGITKKAGILTEPGDRLEAYVTKSGRNVLKIKKRGFTYSATQYPTTGTIVETKVTKMK